jgi:hypothetical protein
MRKLFTTAALSLLCLGAFAQEGPTQISQGTVVLSGSVQFNQSYYKPDQNPSNSRSINQSLYLSPSVGFMLRDGLELGMGIGLHNSLSKSTWDEGEARSKSQALYLSPYIRKYVQLTDFLLLHGTGYTSVGFGRNLENGEQDEDYRLTSRSNSLRVGVYPGLTYLATPKLGITATFGNLSYEVRKSTNLASRHQSEHAYTDKGFYANLSPGSLSLGINYFINR